VKSSAQTTSPAHEAATKGAVARHAAGRRDTAAVEVAPGAVTQAAADRLASLTARGANAACAMIHLADGTGKPGGPGGPDMRLVGSYAVPSGFHAIQQVPMSQTLASLVLRHRYPLVIRDVLTDPRVPANAAARLVGLRAYAGFPVRDPAGEVVGVCAVMDYNPREWRVSDLAATDDGAQACTAFVAERLARDAERDQRHFLDALLNSLDTGVVACDPAGRLVTVNRSLADRFGAGLRGATVDDWAAVNGDGGDPLSHALQGEKIHGAEHELATSDGRTRLFRVNANPIDDDQGRRLGGVAVYHDITEARRAEGLQRALSRSKDEYLNLVGHELRTPLTVIASYLDLIADGDPDSPLAESLSMVDAARRGSDRLRRLVEALLDISALDSGRARLQIGDVDLAQIVREVVRAKAGTARVTVVERLPDRLPMRGDADRLAQLTGALLDNAITYTPEGGTVTVTVSATGHGVRLEVSDTGPGIPEGERPFVFERFFRGAIATEQAIAGAGLGLPTARLIAERHRGGILILPGGPAGTTVRVTLPK
jgi:two-component system phosphate regulon sensor histidine kinase PhoR